MLEIVSFVRQPV